MANRPREPFRKNSYIDAPSNVCLACSTKKGACRAHTRTRRHIASFSFPAALFMRTSRHR